MLGQTVRDGALCAGAVLDISMRCLAALLVAEELGEAVRDGALCAGAVLDISMRSLAALLVAEELGEAVRDGALCAGAVLDISMRCLAALLVAGELGEAVRDGALCAGARAGICVRLAAACLVGEALDAAAALSRAAATRESLSPSSVAPAAPMSTKAATRHNAPIELAFNVLISPTSLPPGALFPVYRHLHRGLYSVVSGESAFFTIREAVETPVI